MRNVDALGVLLVNMDRINHLTCACVYFLFNSACKPFDLYRLSNQSLMASSLVL
jgi:hypothetical protein